MIERRLFEVFGRWFEVVGEDLPGFACISWREPPASLFVSAVFTVSYDPPPRLRASETECLAYGDGWAFWYSRSGRQGTAYFERDRPVDAWQRSAPLRLLIAWALDDEGIALVHAAGVVAHFERYNRGILIGGPSGSGKSTLAAAACDRALSYVGDDWIAVSAASRSMRGIYGSLKLDGRARALGVGKMAKVEMQWSHPEKAVFLMEEDLDSHALDRIVVPKVVQGRSVAIRRISTAEAVRSIAPSTVLQQPQCANTLKSLVRAFEDAECFEMQMGKDPDLAARMLEGLCV